VIAVTMVIVWTASVTVPEGTPPRKLPGGIDSGVERVG
jgi:hypothetical protein